MATNDALNTGVTPLPAARGGTGVANSSTLTWTAANTLQFTTTGATNVTLPTSGTLGSGSVSTVSVVTANNFSGTVATATTTPAITIGANAAQFGAAPSTVSNITGDNTSYTIILNNADINTGTMLNTTTGVWTIPVAGLYTLSGCLVLSGLGAAHTQLSLAMTGATGFYSGSLLDLNPALIRDGTALNICFSANFYSAAGATNSLVLTVAGSTKTVGVVNTTYAGLSLLR